jgi:hypothetical protein
MPKKSVKQMMVSRARRKYNNMLTCIEVLVATLPVAEREIRRINPRVKGRTYRLASQDDLLKMVAGVRQKLITLSETCKQYETKLTTQEWTV